MLQAIFFTSSASMRILRVVYGIYTTCSDQSDFSIWYNYDLSSTYTKRSAPCPNGSIYTVHMLRDYLHAQMAQHTVHMLRDQLYAQNGPMHSTHTKRSVPCPNGSTHSTHAKRSAPCPNGSIRSTHAKRSPPCPNGSICSTHN